MCHCAHVEDLLKRVGIMEEKPDTSNGKGEDLLPDAWAKAGRRVDAEERRAEREADEDDHDERYDLGARIEARHLGLLNNDKLDRSLFGGQETSQSEYRFDGKLGGVIWKEKLTQYFMGKVPALWKILEWAEKHDRARVTETNLNSVVGHFMKQTQQEFLLSQMWGFLSTCVTGSAAVMF